MIATLGQGFLLGLAYAMPIGAQNLYVINSASRGNMDNAMRTALIFALMDITLGIACILGVGHLIQTHAVLRLLIGSLGSGFLLFIGYGLLRKSTPAAVSAKPSMVGSLWKAAFLLTWCNPHALIDGSVLLGGYQSALSAAEVTLFAGGLALASSTWFISLSTVVNRFKTSITPNAMTIINRICGGAMVLFGIRLAFTMVVG
ncbi:MAG: LysE/ArgO family amino acid transporter [Oligoflexales bacterium]